MNMLEAAVALSDAKTVQQDANATIKDLTLRMRKAAGVPGFPRFALVDLDKNEVVVVDTLDGTISHIPIFDGTKVEIEDGAQLDVKPIIT